MLLTFEAKAHGGAECSSTTRADGENTDVVGTDLGHGASSSRELQRKIELHELGPDTDHRSRRDHAGAVGGQVEVVEREALVHERLEAALVGKVVERVESGRFENVSDSSSKTIGLTIEVQDDTDDLVAARSSLGIAKRNSGKQAPRKGLESTLAANAAALSNVLRNLVDGISSDSAGSSNHGIVDGDIVKLELSAGVARGVRTVEPAIVARAAVVASVAARKTKHGARAVGLLTLPQAPVIAIGESGTKGSLGHD